MAMAMLAAYPESFAGGAVIAGLPHGAAGNVLEALASMRRVPEKNAHAWGDAIRNASDLKGPWPVLSVWHGACRHCGGCRQCRSHCGAMARRAGPDVRTEGRKDRRTAQTGVARSAGRAVLESYVLDDVAHGVPIAAGEGLGKAGPFMLEAGIPSSLRIAEFWGLDEEALALSQAERAFCPRADAGAGNHRTW